MLIGIVAHADHTIGQVAEYTAAVFARDHRKAPGTDRVALLRAEEGINFRFLDGDLQFVLYRVEHLHNAVDLHAGMVFIAQVGNRCVAHLPLRDVQVMAIAVHKAATGANSQHPALDTRADAVQILPVGKVIPLAAVG